MARPLSRAEIFSGASCSIRCSRRVGSASRSCSGAFSSSSPWGDALVQAPVAAVVVGAVAEALFIAAALVAACLAIALRFGRGRRGCALHVDAAIGGHPQRALDPIVFALEESFDQGLLDFLLQFERGKLQQPDRLLKLWRQCEMLGKAG